MRQRLALFPLGLLAMLWCATVAWAGDGFRVHQLEATHQGDISSGERLYRQHCAGCHHEDRIGRTGPPLLPQFLRRKKPARLEAIIRHGLPATLMPAFPQLTRQDVAALIAFLSRPAGPITWGLDEIRASRGAVEAEGKDLHVRDIRNITPVVERGANRVWVVEDERILDKFTFANVHGGIKYTPRGERFFVPARDGWVLQYSLRQGRPLNKVRPCVYLRNIALSRDGRRLFATCRLPRQLVVLDSDGLEPRKLLPLKGRVSAIYALYSDDKALFTYRDRPVLAELDTGDLTIREYPLDEPFEDFFIDAFDRYIIGTSRGGKKLAVYDLQDHRKVFEHPIEAMPHLFSATTWYQDGAFHFATPHLGKPYITVWRMYDWAFERKVDVGGDGFFVKTHPATPWLWVDNGSDELVLVAKKDFAIRRLRPMPGKRFNHTEFSGDGRLAYLSIYEPDGALMVLDASTLKPIETWPANVPVGKYNFVNKNRIFYRGLYGLSLFQEKCWGCHHETAEAFGPPFRQIGRQRSDAEIMAHIADPEGSARRLGYRRNLMPAFPLNAEQMASIVEYIKQFGCRPQDGDRWPPRCVPAPHTEETP